MTSLSDAQKDQIEKIHTEMLAQEKALHEKEETDILALLSDDQKAELKKVEENIAAARKEKSAAARRKKMEDAPTTAPAQ